MVLRLRPSVFAQQAPVATVGNGHMYLNTELLPSVSVAPTQDCSDNYLQVKFTI